MVGWLVCSVGRKTVGWLVTVRLVGSVGVLFIVIYLLSYILFLGHFN